MRHDVSTWASMAWLQQQIRVATNTLRHWVVFMGLRRLIGAGVSCVVVLCVGWWLLRSPAPPVELSIPRVPTTQLSASTMLTPTTIPTSITVHVAGAVEKPGVYVLAPQARVIDAVAAAGGPTRSADVNAINLASPLVDSEQIIVPRRGEKAIRPDASSRPSSDSSTKEPSYKKDGQNSLININTASATELETLPGVGPSTAKAIITYRTTVAPFSSIDDLLQVSGIGPAKLEAIRAYIAV